MGIKTLSQGNTRGLSLLSSRLYTLLPPVSSALAAKRLLHDRRHRAKGALGGLIDGGDGRDGKGTGDGQLTFDLAGDLAGKVAKVFDCEVEVT